MNGEPIVKARMRSVTSVRPSTPMFEVAAIMDRQRVAAVPVVDGQRLVGIVSTTDFVATLASAGLFHIPPCASEMMQSPVLTATPDDTPSAVASIFARERVHGLVVVERSRVVGIVTPEDLLVDVKASASATPLADIMVRALATIDLGASVNEAVALLGRAKVHGLVVVDGDRPVGVFTHREAIRSRKLAPLLREGPVEEVMSYETIFLKEDTPVHRAAAYAMAMGVQRILVLAQRRLVGIVSALDLASTLAPPRPSVEETPPRPTARQSISERFS